MSTLFIYTCFGTLYNELLFSKQINKTSVLKVISYTCTDILQNSYLVMCLVFAWSLIFSGIDRVIKGRKREIVKLLFICRFLKFCLRFIFVLLILIFNFTPCYSLCYSCWFFVLKFLRDCLLFLNLATFWIKFLPVMCNFCFRNWICNIMCYRQN